MWYEKVLLCPFCKSETNVPGDRLEKKLYRLCKKCGRLVSKKACIKEQVTRYEV